jgi:hypothetical protein
VPAGSRKYNSRQSSRQRADTPPLVEIWRRSPVGGTGET